MRQTEYVWNEANRAIRLSMDLLSRLSLEATKAFQAVPRRSLDVGGLLLGTTEAGSIYIRDFEAVESEHRAGPSYTLSETDIARFEEALARHSDAVGIYRTHSLDKPLSLQEDEAVFFKNHFTDPDGVFLLIQPVRRRAAFFLPRNGTLEAVHEFPFHSSDLEPPPVAAPATAGRVGTKPKSRPALGWMVPIAAVICGMAAGALLYGYLHPAVETKPIPAADTGSVETAHVALNAQRDGTSIRLQWDRSSPTIRRADKGILYIIDGDHQSQLNLDPSELGSGVVSYWPESKDVTFRLEVFGAGHSSDDSIRVVGGAPAPPVVPPRQTATRPPPPPRAAAAPPPAEPTSPSPVGGASRVDSSPQRPSPFTPVPKPSPPPSIQPIAAAAVEPPRPAPHETHPEVSVVAEPVGHSGFGSAIGKIPLLRRLRKQKQPFVPPAPSHEYHPVLTASERRGLDRSVAVDVRVWVGENGKVQYAELMSSAAAHRDLATTAVYAARRWDFTPAHVGDEKVPGEVILHFKFSPEGPPNSTP